MHQQIPTETHKAVWCWVLQSCSSCLKASPGAAQDTHSRKPGLCFCSLYGPNWIWHWWPANSQALSKETGWEPFRMSSRACGGIKDTIVGWAATQPCHCLLHIKHNMFYRLQRSGSEKQEYIGPGCSLQASSLGEEQYQDFRMVPTRIRLELIVVALTQNIIGYPRVHPHHGP